jgi:NADPH2:quinone reductase
MKAAVIHKFGDIPQFQDFPDPIVDNDDILVDVKAVVLENFDKITASGKHYASKRMFSKFPAIIGHIGIGSIADGTLIAFGGIKPPYGTMAEKALVPQQYKKYMTQVPDGVDLVVAAALPTAALTSFLPLKWGAKLQKGETVLINGATGVSGKVAVQLAKILGAGRIIGTGRNDEGLHAVKQLGADAVIDLKQSDEQIMEAFTKEARKGYNIVLDFLWGRPSELFLKILVPKEAAFATHRTRFIQIGAAADSRISLNAETLRTSGLEMTGAGNISSEVVQEAAKQVWEWIKEHKLTMDIEKVPMKDIAEVWNRKTEGKRFVIIP